MTIPDIDIDFPDRNKVLEELFHIPASMIQKDELKKHNVGVYFQDIPIDPVTGLASIDYHTAGDLGYIKFDFLNVGVYKGVRDSDHLALLCEKEPDWSKLQDQKFVDKLFHLSGNFDIVQKLKPTNVEEIAIVIAIKIPSKRYLINKPWTVIRNEIWKPMVSDGFVMKKSHALSYSLVVMMQMNILTGL